MAKAAVQKHTHKLKRVKYKSGNASYFCVLPDCTYKVNPPLSFGKRTVCWRCGDEFLMDEYTIRLAKPHCHKCHKPKGDHIEIKFFPPPDQTVATDDEQSTSETDRSGLSLADKLTTLFKKAEGEEDI